MQTVNSHQAKARPSRLVKPSARRLGFLAERIAVPEDFDRMGGDQIEHLFGDAP